MKNGVKYIQAPACNGAQTVDDFTYTFVMKQTQQLFHSLFLYRTCFFLQVVQDGFALCLGNRKKKAAICVNNVGETQALKVQNCS